MSAPTTPAASPASRTVELDGLRFHYLDWGGDGPPLVMLHGFTGHAHTWDHAAAGLRDRYHVYALDQRGHGDSQWAGEYSLDLMVADAVAFLDHLRLGPVVLVGLSLGGVNSFLLAGTHPEHVERLVVLDIGPEIEPPAATAAAPDVFSSEEEAVAAARATNTRPSDESLRTRVVYNLRTLPDGRVTFKWDKIAAEAIADLRRSSERLWSAWSAVQAPTLLLRGDDSNVFSAETARRMLAENPNAELVVIEDCGHSIPTDRPESLLDVLVPWLDKTSD